MSVHLDAGALADVDQLRRDLAEAHAFQVATSETLAILSTFPRDAQPVLDAIVESAARLTGSIFGNIRLFDGENLRAGASWNFPSQVTKILASRWGPPGRWHLVGRAILDRKIVHVPDVLDDPDYAQEYARSGGWRGAIGVPLMRDGRPIGAIAVGKAEPGPYSASEVRLISAFADQAVIAIENARLFAEIEARNQDLRLSLDRERAMSEILSVINAAPTDAQPVFEAIASKALELCDALFANVFLYRDGVLHFVANCNLDAASIEIMRSRYPAPADRSHVSGRVVMSGEVVRLEDAFADPEYDQRVPRSMGWQRVLGVPMLKDGQTIGVIVLGWKQPGKIPDSIVSLLRSFAEQAVIALENTRLFAEVQARTQALEETLEYQTATSEVLGVISRSPTDAQPVFNAIAESAARLCNAMFSVVYLYDGSMVRIAAASNLNADVLAILKEHYPRAPDRAVAGSAAILDRRIVHVTDTEADRDYSPRIARIGGWKASMGVPILRDGEPVGSIAVSKAEKGPFSDRQINLLKTFADQAVIAIENVRLFQEVQARTAELQETLEHQTATGDVLRVISGSPSRIEPVFDTIATTARRLCGADAALIFRLEDGVYRLRAHTHSDAAAQISRHLMENPIRPGRKGAVTTRAAMQLRAVHVPDMETDTELDSDLQAVGGRRAILSVPLVRDGVAIGVITMLRSAERPFTPREVDLVSTFAGQAVIAINNVELFTRAEDRSRELAEALDQQIATADVLKVISNSAFDLPAVLKTLVEAAARLCKADQGTIAREQDGAFLRVATHGFSEQFDALVRHLPVVRERGTAAGRALAEGGVVHIHDVTADPEYTFADALRFGEFRTVLAVPMLREGEAIGVLALTRKRREPFSEKEIELASTFANQAAIAIENVRLYEAATARSTELAKSLTELRATQDRLVQTEKLASLGQMTAGIAHEIKNPLNFVNNFASVSAELVDELIEVLEATRLPEDAAGEVQEIAGMLRANLEKIVQHGGRADSIVRNMLLHARQGTSEHRPVEINALVDEALGLAYHGARAGQKDFNVTLTRDFDPAAGRADVFPQEITRVLLNLISNGFYAATKRKATEPTGSFEPVLAVSTRDRGPSVEVTVRDNGAGIPAAVKEQMFLPFFTTKPAGEGTGLGLSISHDIVVKQHGGQLDVSSEPGVFTEFRVLLPRTISGSDAA